MIAVTNVVNIQEKNGVKTKPESDELIYVASHWKDDNFVILKIGDESYTVSANHLRAAIDNATNTARVFV